MQKMQEHFSAGREHPVEAGEIDSWLRHQGSQSGNKIKRLENHMGGAVSERGNTNYGCSIIIWDRIFGTFSGKTEIERVGNGTGKKLSLWTQLALPFYSNERIRRL